MASLLEVADERRLQAGPVRRDPAGPHRQAPRHFSRNRRSHLVAYLPGPVRDPGVELRPAIDLPPPRWLRCGNAPSLGSDVELASDHPVPGLRMDVPATELHPGRLVRCAASRPVCSIRGSRWRRDPRGICLDLSPRLLALSPRLPPPWHAPVRDLKINLE